MSTPTTEKTYPAPAPSHGSLTKISDNVYIVPGSFQMAPGIRITLTMSIVKRSSDLTIINSMRVSSDVEQEIKKLGTIKNVVRICSNHGAHDEYYVDTFNATYYDIPNAASTKGTTKVPSTDNILEDGKEVPGISGSKVYFVKNIKMPEALVLLPKSDGGNGILITGDLIQSGHYPPRSTMSARGSNFITKYFINMDTGHTNFVASHILNPLLGFSTGSLTTPPPYFQFYGNGEDIYVNVPIVMEFDFDSIITGT